MPLGILTVIVLAVILSGITTATESAAVGAAGTFIFAGMMPYMLIVIVCMVIMYLWPA
jgi:TRAP-type mannitol/chloroaromatic compound transport system permease large subunit